MTRGLPFLLVVLLVSACARSGDRRLLERENPDVQDGIARLRRNDARGALAAFDRAARTHPSAPEVALDRGLALLAANRHPEAREAFVRATGEDASRELRAEALYDLGLSHHRTADEAARGEDHEAPQRDYREAIEAYRRSLRTLPGRTDVAWNLEIALRRLADEEREEQQEQQDQQQQQQDQQQQQQDQQQQQQDQAQNQQQHDQQQQGQQQQEPQQGGQQNPQNQQGQQQAGQQNPQQGQQQAGQQNPQQGQQPQNPPPPSGGGAGGREPQQEASAARQADGADSLSPESRAMLDALDRGEGSLEAERARVRAAQERRRLLQDW